MKATQQVWMGITVGVRETRVLGTEDEEVILKGRLLPNPSHPRALQWLLEAVALWQGQPVRAVLNADDPEGLSVTHFRADWFTDFGNALYELELCKPKERRRKARLKDRMSGLGEYRDLKQMRLEELIAGGWR